MSSYLFAPLSGLIHVNAMVSFTSAILLLFVGKALTNRIDWLRRYSIPDALAGGALCAVLVCVLDYAGGPRIVFDLEARETLLLYFFAAIGLNSRLAALWQGGRRLVLLLALAVGFMVLQNLVGMGLAVAHGLDARLGLMVGSVSLVGGAGTTLAWMPYFTETLGLSGAGELGLAANTVGLLAACAIGGPVAGWLLRRQHVRPSADAQLEIGLLHQAEPTQRLEYEGMLQAIFWLNLALLLGQVLGKLMAWSGLNLPDFVGCLMAGILLRLAGDLMTRNARLQHLWPWQRMRPGVALISDICLGLFLVMALMGLQLAALRPMLGFITLALTLQILLALAFTVWVVFRCMGRDYDAVVVCAGFGGIALGSTATAVANMTAVVRQYGAAPQAFILVPLVCGFFIDLANALVIGWMAG